MKKTVRSKHDKAAKNQKQQAVNVPPKPTTQTPASPIPTIPAPYSIKLRPGNEAQLIRLSHIHKVSIEALHFARDRGVLLLGEWNGYGVWGVKDKSDRTLLLRRLSGLPFPASDLKPKRAFEELLVTDSGWPIGILEAKICDCIALVVGCVDFLHLHQVVVQQAAESTVGAVCMMSEVGITPDALPHFAGKKVRICLNGQANRFALAECWKQQLKNAGVKDVSICGRPIKEFLS